MSKIYTQKLKDVMKETCCLVNDETEVVLFKGCMRIKGKWYEDRIMDRQEEWVEAMAINFVQNKMEVMLRSEVQQ